MGVLFGGGQFGGAVTTKPIRFITPPKSSSSLSKSAYDTDSDSEDPIELPDALIGQNRVYSQQMLQMDKLGSMLQSELYKELKRTDGDMAEVQSMPKIRKLMNTYQQMKMEMMVQKNHLETQKKQWVKNVDDISDKGARDQFFVNNGQRMFMSPEGDIVPEVKLTKMKPEERNRYRALKASDYENVIPYLPNYRQNQGGISTPGNVLTPRVFDQSDGANPFVDQLRKTLKGTEGNLSKSGETKFIGNFKEGVEGLYMRVYSESGNNLNQLNSAVNNFYTNMTEQEKLGMRQEMWSNWGGPNGGGPAAIGEKLNVSQHFGDKYAKTVAKAFGLKKNKDGDFVTGNQRVKEQMYTLYRGLSMKDEHIKTSSTSKRSIKEMPEGGGGTSDGSGKMTLPAAIHREQILNLKRASDAGVGYEDATVTGMDKGKPRSIKRKAITTYSSQLSSYLTDYLFGSSTDQNPYPTLSDNTDHIMTETGQLYGENDISDIFNNSVIVGLDNEVVTMDMHPQTRNGQIASIGTEKNLSPTSYIKANVFVPKDRGLIPESGDTEFYNLIEDPNSVEKDDNFRRWGGYKTDFEKSFGIDKWEKMSEPVMINGKEYKKGSLISVYLPIPSTTDYSASKTPSEHNRQRSNKRATNPYLELMRDAQEKKQAQKQADIITKQQ